MTNAIDTRVCCGGMICEEHPDRAWPDGDPGCSGPGMPCLHPAALEGRAPAPISESAPPPTVIDAARLAADVASRGDV